MYLHLDNNGKDREETDADVVGAMSEPAAIHVTLVPAGDDGGQCSEPCQRALRHFFDQLRDRQTKVMPRIFTTDRADAAGTLVGEKPDRVDRRARARGGDHRAVRGAGRAQAAPQSGRHRGA